MCVCVFFKIYFILPWSCDSLPPAARPWAWKFQMYTRDQTFPLNTLVLPVVPTLYLSQQIFSELKTKTVPNVPALGASG